MVSSLPVVLHVSHLARPCVAFSIKGPLWPSFLEESIALQSFRGASAGTETFAVPLVAHYFQALCRKNKELIDRYALNRFATAGVSANPTFLCAASVSATIYTHTIDYIYIYTLYIYIYYVYFTLYIYNIQYVCMFLKVGAPCFTPVSHEFPFEFRMNIRRLSGPGALFSKPG